MVREMAKNFKGLKRFCIEIKIKPYTIIFPRQWDGVGMDTVQCDFWLKEHSNNCFGCGYQFGCYKSMLLDYSNLLLLVTDRPHKKEVRQFKREVKRVRSLKDLLAIKITG